MATRTRFPHSVSLQPFPTLIVWFDAFFGGLPFRSLLCRISPSQARSWGAARVKILGSWRGLSGPIDSRSLLLRRSRFRLRLVLFFAAAILFLGRVTSSAQESIPDAKVKTPFSKLSVSPKKVSYKVDIDKGEFSKTEHFSIKNDGTLALVVTVNSPSNPDYVITSGGGQTTIPGKGNGDKNSLTVDVEFNPHGPGKNVDGSVDITSNATSEDSSATVNLKGRATQKKPTPTATATATATATPTVTATPTATPTPGPGHSPLAQAGLFVQFDERGFPNGYYPGQLIQKFTQVDPVVGTTVEAEASLQLDKMKALGVNTITTELRTSDPSCVPESPTGCDSTFPSCLISYALGLDWPQPTQTELTNLKSFFDLVQSKGMKINLGLTFMHMDEPAPRPNSQLWLGSIFNEIKGHPALDLILINGDAYRIDTTPGGTGLNQCGIEGEPPFFLGPDNYAATFVEWAISYAMSLGIPARQLSAEAIVGFWPSEAQLPAGANAEDGHLWSPIHVLKTVFDDLAIPESQRAYALSFYEHSKCFDNQSGQPCTDLDPHDWANQTLQEVISTVGNAQAGQVLMTEGGTGDPQDWPAQFAFESIGYLMQVYQLPGGTFWRWADSQDSEESDPTVALPVKQRGVAFDYYPPKNEIVDLGGFHLTWIPNGSFEQGGAGNVPTDWTVTGSGTGVDYFLAGEPNEPQVPSRGQYDLRLTTGSNATSSVTATSEYIQATAATAYTTTGNLRFAWTGDPNPSATPATRPQVFVAFNYFQSPGVPSAVKTQDIFPFYQENSTTDFQTFPLQYTTPSDATSLQIVIGAARNNLPTEIIFDADNLR